MNERLLHLMGKIGNPSFKGELCLAGQKEWAIQGLDPFDPCHEYVGLKRSGVKLSKGNSLGEGYHQASFKIKRGVLS